MRLETNKCVLRCVTHRRFFFLLFNYLLFPIPTIQIEKKKSHVLVMFLLLTIIFSIKKKKHITKKISPIQSYLVSLLKWDT